MSDRRISDSKLSIYYINRFTKKETQKNMVSVPADATKSEHSKVKIANSNGI